MLPPHSDIALGHPGLQGGLQIDPNQPQQPAQQQGQQPPSSGSSRKRRKTDSGEDAGPAEPRRLRRSHEACARCRGKKIKASPVGVARPQTSATLANITLPTTHSAIRSIPDVPLVRPPAPLASKRTVIVRPSRLVATLSASSVSSSKAWHYSSAMFPVST